MLGSPAPSWIIHFSEGRKQESPIQLWHLVTVQDTEQGASEYFKRKWINMVMGFYEKEERKEAKICGQKVLLGEASEWSHRAFVH